MSNESVMAAARRVDAIGGAGESFETEPPFPVVDRPERPHIVSGFKAVEKAVARGVAEVLADLQAKADAQMVLARAMKRGGRDPVAVQPTDAQALDAIAAVLMNVQRTAEDEPEAALRVAIERGDAVARAIAGQG